MDSMYFTKPLIFIIQTLLGLYSTLVVLRFLLQAVRADFYNPISQFIVMATATLLRPLRQTIPGFGGFDLASIVLAWLVKTLELFLVVLLLGGGVNLFGAALLWAIPQLIELILNIFLLAILIEVVLSWISYPGMYNPAASLARSLSEPIIEPVQNIMPDMGGLDFSPMVASMILVLTEMLLLPPIKMLTGSPF